MEFLDEFDSKPRLMFQSKASPQSTDSEALYASSSFSSIHKPTLFVCVSLSFLFAYIAIVYIDIEPLKSFLLWLSCSLILGPFAPRGLTGGDISVGIGPCLREIPAVVDLAADEKSHRKSTKPSRKPADDPVRFDGFVEKSKIVDESLTDLDESESNSSWPLAEENCEEREWSRTDDELLRKLMVRNPVGKPGRWEAIAEGFKGKHKVESVITRGKELGLRKASDQDPFKKFLEDRKPINQSILDKAEHKTGGEIIDSNADGKESGWSAGEDLSLLNALKAFPKDATMRWEKIAASLPGKTKAACMKRVTELKRDFRSSKTSTGQAS